MSHSTDSTELLTARDVSRILGISVWSVWWHVDRGTLPKRKVGPVYVFTRADLEGFVRPKPGRKRKQQETL